MSSLIILAKDGFPLVGQCYAPTVQPLAAVVIASATGLNQSFYASFSRWLATHGVLVYTFDYRYFGLSFPPPHRPSTFTPEERQMALLTAPPEIDISETWARQDLGGVVRYVATNIQSLRGVSIPLVIMGHSLGGQIMTLLEEEFPLITRFLNICGGNAYYGNKPNPRAQLAQMEKMAGRSLEIDRVFRCAKLGMGHDLPYGPGRQWLTFYRHPLCMASIPKNALAMRRMNRPYLYVGFDDDTTMSKLEMTRMMALFSHSHPSHKKYSLWISPSSRRIPWPPTGHAGSFVNPKSSAPFPRREETVWPVYLRWILHEQIDEQAGEVQTWHEMDEKSIEQLWGESALDEDRGTIAARL